MPLGSPGTHKLEGRGPGWRRARRRGGLPGRVTCPLLRVVALTRPRRRLLCTESSRGRFPWTASSSTTTPGEGNRAARWTSCASETSSSMSFPISRTLWTRTRCERSPPWSTWRRPPWSARTGISRIFGLDAKDYTTVDAVVKLLAEHPRLMQRPIAVRGGRAVVGRPSEKVEQLL